MEGRNITARIELNVYANKVLTMLKAKYGLKTKSEAINKFAEIYGDDIVEKEAKDEYAKHILEVTNSHLEKHKNKKMSIEELDALFEK